MTTKNSFKKIGSSTTSSTENIKRKELLVRLSTIIIGIHSNVGSNADFSDGHAWLSVSRDGITTNYGLWPDDHPTIISLGHADSNQSDIRIGMEDGQVPLMSRYYKLTTKQNEILKIKINENITWHYTNTCASWASETATSVTGENIQANDTLGFETPRKLSETINRLEKIRKTSSQNPQGIPDDAHASTSY